MFFVVSKVFWFFAQPLNVVAFMLALGVVLMCTRFQRAGRRILTLTTIAFIAVAFLPFNAVVLRPLEDRFPRPPQNMPAPQGIIVLGGAMDEVIDSTRDVFSLNYSGSRMTEGVILARRFPQVPLIFTGGSGSLRPKGMTEADDARRLFLALGVPQEQIVIEDQSRNTYENAIYTREIVKPRADQRYLLVTSAFHMSRAMGVFRRAGFNVVAWPADYRTTGLPGDYWRLNQSSSGAMLDVEIGVKEWIGLLAYRASGMTDALLPGP